jgi:hypothetical protein
MDKNTLKKLLLDENSDDENASVIWLDNNCTCCNDCDCSNNIICKNCGCECCIKFDEETINDKNVSNINIDIIEDTNKEKKVRITLEINVKINDTIELMCIDVDINKITYLNIANKLIV